MKTLIKAIDTQPEVLKEPAPVVAFEAFGDNALTFHVYYWLDIGHRDGFPAAGYPLAYFAAHLGAGRNQQEGDDLMDAGGQQRGGTLFPTRSIGVRL
jgi:small-conductance mechanosensitive channel